MSNPPYKEDYDYSYITTTYTWYTPIESNSKPDSLNMSGRIANAELFRKLLKNKYGKK